MSCYGAAWLLGCGLAIRVRRVNKGAAWLLVCGMANLECGVATWSVRRAAVRCPRVRIPEVSVNRATALKIAAGFSDCGMC